MKVLVLTRTFYPNIGGIERQAEVLCRSFVKLGHDTILVTQTPSSESDSSFDFEVVRNPGMRSLLRLVNWCDVQIQVNVSIKLAWLGLTGKPLVYIHANAYERDDGSRSALDRLKAFIGAHMPGIANSHYTASRVGCGTVVFNPYDDSLFENIMPRARRDRQLVFLGRLVSQKGCDTLLMALGLLKARGLTPQLTVIGDGPDRQLLEKVSAREQVSDQVRFVGAMSGQPLVAELNRHTVMIVPSRYAEPFGIVALEGLACGLLPVVSIKGGLIDAIGPHGLVFENGDEEALAKAICHALDRDTEECLLANVDKHLESYRADEIANSYVSVIDEVVVRATRASASYGHRKPKKYRPL